jgi:phenylpropionate dioxygenase-like ring-hydroxylating dioxygenase large terminal subunit
MAALRDGPRGFTLLGERLVLWLDRAGQPAAIADRCCHRSALLSKGFVEGDAIVCRYHGWAYDRTGAVTRIPQAAGLEGKTHPRTPGYRCVERYGHVWVCLDEPIAAIPDVPEAADPAFRRIDEFDEEWEAAPLRILENSFDNAHFTYVHQASFGDPDPTPPKLTIDDHDDGFTMRTEVPVRVDDTQAKAIGIASARTVRRTENRYFVPFFRAGRINYAHGLVHILVSASTPIDDTRTQFIQFVLRNDREADASAADVIAFDRLVTNEDRAILEACDTDVPLDTRDGGEFHMPSDRPGLLMRRHVLAVLRRHGENESRRR